jgi:hypothetical protein
MTSSPVPSAPAATPSADPALKAAVLAEYLPYLRPYAGRTIVVKYGGSALSGIGAFARDIVILKQVGIHPIVVHGGGPQIGEMLKRLGIKSEFAAGLRITDKATIEIVEMVLAGSINKQIVGYINAAGGKAIGLTGKDGDMVKARKVTRTVVDPDSNIEKVVDLGFVGEPDKVDDDGKNPPPWRWGKFSFRCGLVGNHHFYQFGNLFTCKVPGIRNVRFDIRCVNIRRALGCFAIADTGYDDVPECSCNAGWGTIADGEGNTNRPMIVKLFLRSKRKLVA